MKLLQMLRTTSKRAVPVFAILGQGLIYLSLVGCGEPPQSGGAYYSYWSLHPSSRDDDPYPYGTYVPYEETSAALEARNLVRTENQNLVRQCALRVADTDLHSVIYQNLDICTEPENYSGNKVAYYLRRQGDIFELSSRLGLVTSQASSRSQVMLAQVQACLPQLRSVWQRYGITVQIEVVLVSRRNEPGQGFDHYIEIFDDVGRSTSHVWHLRGFSSENDQNRCSMILHEVGHLFGLNDDYEDLSRCPHRRFESRQQEYTNVMKNVRESFDWMDFYPRHLTRILDPICGETPHLGTARTLEAFSLLFHNSIWTRSNSTGESITLFPTSSETSSESLPQNVQVAFQSDGIPYLLYPSPEVYFWQQRAPNRMVSPSRISSGPFHYRVWDSQANAYFYTLPRN